MISIRPGTRDDIPQAFALVTELAIYEKAADQVSNTVEKMAEDGFGANPLFGMLIAEDSDNQKIVGMALYYFRYSTWKGKRLYLEDIIVTEAFRGYGIGKLLLDAVGKRPQVGELGRAELGARPQVLWAVGGTGHPRVPVALDHVRGVGLSPLQHLFGARAFAHQIA